MLARLMARKPDDRYQTGGEVSEALLRVTGGGIPPLALAAPRARAHSNRGLPSPTRGRAVLLIGLAIAALVLLYLALQNGCS